MPRRAIPLVTGQFYHVFNRGINKQTIFSGVREYKRAIDILAYYSFATPKLRFSKFLLLSQEKREEFWNQMAEENNKLVNIIAFCLMPNHFHFLLEQTYENGISKFMSNFQNSYTRYYNTTRDGVGPLLQGQFKAVHIEDENQLLHTSRYIHLNPYTSFVVKEFADLLSYPWSSLGEYISTTNSNICSKGTILSQFKNAEEYQAFVFDQAAYQRELDIIKHLTLEK